MKSMVSASLFLLILGSALTVYSSPARCLTASALSSDVLWSLYLNDQEIQSDTISAGSEFVFDASTISISGSSELLAALDGIRFTLNELPTTGVEIRLILNTRGNVFSPVQGKACSFNMTVITFIDGHETQTAPISISMTLPNDIGNGAGLNYLLGLSGLTNRTDLAFATFTGGSIKAERVDSTVQVQGVLVVIDTPTTIVGGNSTDLGIPATVEFSTWYKVKKLFE